MGWPLELLMMMSTASPPSFCICTVYTVIAVCQGETGKFQEKFWGGRRGGKTWDKTGKDFSNILLLGLFFLQNCDITPYCRKGGPHVGAQTIFAMRWLSLWKK